jgi:Transposase
MERRRFTREFKVEAVKLVRERGVAVVQAARDLNVHENCAAEVGEGVRRRSAACASRAWSLTPTARCSKKARL